MPQETAEPAGAIPPPRRKEEAGVWRQWARKAAALFRRRKGPAGAKGKGPEVAPIPGVTPPPRQEPLRALAFAGAGFDAVMQLGVIHALLASRAKAPDLVVGVSTGAINAAALAEVLQAGTGLATDEERQRARVARFRELLLAWEEMPGEILQALRPDATELNAQAQLTPLQLPIHHPRERIERRLATYARFGVIRLLNGLLRVPVPLRTLTKAVRRLLELRQLDEWRCRFFTRRRLAQPPSRNPFITVPGGVRVAVALDAAASRVVRGIRKWWEYLCLWAMLSCRLPQLTDLLGQFTLGLLCGGRYKRMVEAEEKAAEALHGAQETGAVRGRKKRRFWRWVMRRAGLIRDRTAKQIILPFLPGLWFRRLALGTLGIISGMALCATVGALLLLCPVLPLLLAVTALFAFGYWAGGGSATALSHSVGQLLLRLDAGAAIVLLLGLVLAGAALRLASWERLLATFDLKKDLATPYLLKPRLIRLFDSTYYGPTRPSDFATVLERAVDPAAPTAAGGGQPRPKQLADYFNHNADRRKVDPPIWVVPVAANVQTGELECLSLQAPVVDALLGATARVPFLRAQWLAAPANPAQWAPYIDGVNVANEPTYALLDLLRRAARGEQVVPGLSLPVHRRDIQVFPVAPFPLQEHIRRERRPAGHEPADGIAEEAPYDQLADVMLRARDLEAFQGAKIERKLVGLYHKALAGSGQTVVEIERPDGERTALVGCEFHPIELNSPPRLSEQLFATQSMNERRRLVGEVVADGCRAALQVLLAQTFTSRRPVGETIRSPAPQAVCCGAVIAARLPEGAEAGLPGSVPAVGPGLLEVCRHCRLRADGQARPSQGVALKQHLQAPASRAADGSGVVRSVPGDWPTFDGQGAKPANLPEPRQPAAPVEKPATARSSGWPLPREGVSRNERPTVSLLFSGGVFRGVFQIGVINALSELGLQPDMVAGASIGSITAALTAELFSACRQDRDERARRIAEAAATFLVVDRLVVTDRFADFVRRFTLRAAATEFSMRDLDQFLRRYDTPHQALLGRSTRRVIAGFERLFYLNPFELLDLVKSVRQEDLSEAWRLVKADLGRFLERSGVGIEILGTEPLNLLIHQHILAHHPELNCDHDGRFDLFVREGRGIHFLATATNLTRGELKILSSRPPPAKGQAAEVPVLAEGLLASSAFPGVFRPRWSWEVFPGSANREQFIDGGYMDNLPLDAVATFLDESAQAGEIAYRPRRQDGRSAPHLILTASLEVGKQDLSQAANKGERAGRQRQLERVVGNWVSLKARAAQLRYNTKVHKFAEAQRDLRAIEDQVYQKSPGEFPKDILDLEVLCVEPEWLCDTFGFHPMLGFRRERQAASIAHGCAATFAQIHAYTRNMSPAEESRRKDWLQFWGLADNFEPNCLRDGQLEPDRNCRPGGCWFRPGCDCPFGPQRLRSLDLLPQTKLELEEIYRLCGRLETHRRA
jgi:predicted acylesterase/phospholipase RssA